MAFARLHTRERQLLGARPGATGVAVSGGGIRSATFALGVFQAWAEAGQLPHIDYLSTVSGGGYFGTFLGRLFARPYVASVDEVAWVLGEGKGPMPPRVGRTEEQERELKGAAGNAVNWLREHGRYLAPRGSGDLLTLGAALFRNWLSIQVLLALAGVCLFVGLRLSGAVVRWFDVPDWAPLSRGVLPVAALAITLGLVWAYWLAWAKGGRRWIAVGLAVGAGVLAVAWPGEAPLPAAMRMAFAGAGVVALVTASARVSVYLIARTREGDADRYRMMRNQLAGGLRNAMVGFAVVAVVMAIDTLSLWLYGVLRDGDRLRAALLALPALLAGLGSVARQVTVLFSQPSQTRTRPGWLMAVAAYAGAALVVGLLLVSYSLLSYVLVQQMGAAPVPGVMQVLPWFAALGVMVLAFGNSQAFINQSSHMPLYSARLSRAYLGASNPLRWMGTPRSPLEPEPGDDLSMDDYWVGAEGTVKKGAPVHLVNLTVNETFEGKSQVQQQDRQGMGMAVGPGGISLGRRHHVAFADPPGRAHEPGDRLCLAEPVAPVRGFEVFAYDTTRQVFRHGEAQVPAQAFLGERLLLSQWVALSGAAFSTGLGSRTNIGLSLLAGLFNIRLGHWWDSGVDPAKRTGVARGPALSRWMGGALHGVLPLYYYLLSELVARFPGVAKRRWYLTDGGHFENLGGYELVRRRLPRIVILDAEADPGFSFGGLANLVRKARMDFGAHIDFKKGLDQLCPSHTPCGFAAKMSAAHVAVAEVTYPATDAEPALVGTLVYVKASLTGDEDADVLEYARSHPAFPHETTADQFFDEAQWESYRRLGYHVGRATPPPR